MKVIISRIFLVKFAYICNFRNFAVLIKYVDIRTCNFRNFAFIIKTAQFRLINHFLSFMDHVLNMLIFLEITQPWWIPSNQRIMILPPAVDRTDRIYQSNLAWDIIIAKRA